MLKGEKTHYPHCCIKVLYRHAYARPRKALHAYVLGKRIYLKEFLKKMPSQRVGSMHRHGGAGGSGVSVGPFFVWANRGGCAD